MLDFTSLDTVRRVCGWCGKEMGRVAARLRLKHPVTHGLCEACFDILSNFKSIPLEQS